MNMECALRILEKNGFNVEEGVEEGEPLSGSKKLKDDVKLFQVHCSAPYVKFEARIDDAVQKNILEALNHGLEGLLKPPPEKK